MNIPTLRRLAFSITCILSVGLASVSRAEDEKIPEIKTASGKTYQDVRITKVTPSEISIIHESGVARIPLKDLPGDLKTKFGYDAAKAEAHAKAKSQADAQAEKQMAEAEKKNAEMKALLKAAKPGIFIVDREEEKGLLVGNLDMSRDEYYRPAIAEMYENQIRSGGGKLAPISLRGFEQYLLLGVPNQGKLVQNTFVSGLFVHAGTAKREDGSSIKVFRYVGSAKDCGDVLDTVDN